MARFLASIFLCCLASGNASKMTGSSTLTALSKSIMLQMKETPEVAQKFSDMANTITNVLEGDIRQGQAWTQTHIDWYNADLKEITDDAANLMTTADVFFDQLAQCRRDLFVQAGAICTCDSEEVDLCNKMEELCVCVPSTTWKLEAVHFGPQWCDLHTQSVPTDCAPINSLNEAVTNIKEGIESDYGVWKDCYEACEDATKKCNDKKEECKGLRSTAEKKKAECVVKESTFNLEACLFGNKVQTKCYDYTSLMGFLTTAWTPSQNHFSEIDRQNEWVSIQKIKCVLSSYSKADRKFLKELNGTDSCSYDDKDQEIDYDYAGRVGVLDNKAKSLNDLMAEGGKSTCGHSPTSPTGWESNNRFQDSEGIETQTIFGAGKWVNPLGPDYCQKMVETDKSYAAMFKDISQQPYHHCQSTSTYSHVTDHTVNRGSQAGTVEAGSETNIYTR